MENNTSTKNSLGDKIEHVVVLMLENRGFDSFLGNLYTKNDPPSNYIPSLQSGKLLFEGLDFIDPTKYTNTFDFKGAKLSMYPQKGVSASNTPGYDPGEEFSRVNAQLFDIDETNDPPANKTPTMTGFLRDYSKQSNEENSTSVTSLLSMYCPTDLPVLNGLAKEYAVCDEWFASVPTQTNANRAFSLCGTSNGLVDNGFFTTNPVAQKLADDRFEVDTIWNVLSNNGNQDWGVFWGVGYPLYSQKESYTRKVFPHLDNIPNVDNHFHVMEDFYKKAHSGRLPKFSYIEPSWGGYIYADVSAMGNEYHPPSDVTPGEELLKNIYNALSSSQKWDKTLFVIVFDEHGGTFDHVSPPVNAKPPWGTNTNPNLPKGKQYGFNFDRFGVRVPAIFVSPLIPKQTVLRSDSDVPFDHTSVISTLLEWLIPNVPKSSWGLGERVAAAPSFANVVALETPRKDRLFVPKAPDSKYIKKGDPITLMHVDSQEIVSIAESDLTAYFPTLGGYPSATLELRYQDGKIQASKDGEVFVQIRTSEYLEPRVEHLSPFVFPGIRNFLGKFGETDCYYYTAIDGKTDKTQDWNLSRPDTTDPDPYLKDGDEVVFRLNWSKQTLCKNGKYLSTKVSGTPEKWRIRHKNWGITLWVSINNSSGGHRYSTRHEVLPGFSEPRDSGIRVFAENYPSSYRVNMETKNGHGGPIYRYMMGTQTGVVLGKPDPNPWKQDTSVKPFYVWLPSEAYYRDPKSVAIYVHTKIVDGFEIYKLSLNSNEAAFDKSWILFYAPTF